MIQRKKEVDGDLFIPGSITVLGGINSSAYRKTVTTLARTEGRVETVEGTVTVLEEAIAGLSPPMPPTENVTNILLETTANADGSLHVEITWDYAPEDPETVPATIIAGCAIVYMSAGIIPAPPELTTKSVGRIIPMSGAGSYSWSGDFPARQIANDNNTFPIHYRFGIVAANASSGEVKIHADGIIDGGTDWRDIVSGSIISVDNGNFWNLVTGEFMATIGYDQSFHIDPANEEARLVNIPLTSYKGAGVNRTATRLDNDSLDWLDTPDTSPASDELLTARIGRLGVGGTVLLNGDFATNITSAWSAVKIINLAYSGGPVVVNTKNNTLRLAYQALSGNYYIAERIWNGSSWGPETVICSVSSACPAYIERASGELRIAYRNYNEGALVERIWNGSSWGPESIIVTGTNYLFPTYIEISGSLRVAYITGSNFLVEKVWNGSSWGTETVINNTLSYYPKFSNFGSDDVRIAYTRNISGVTRLVERDWNGSSWGEERIISSEPSHFPSYIRLITGEIRIAYARASDKIIFERIWNGSSWGPESQISTIPSNFPTYFQITDGELRIVYNTNDSNVHLHERTLQRYAQLGAGIIESGSNSNGSYVKFSDGTMQQWYHMPPGSASGNWVFPQEFFTFGYIVTGSAWLGTTNTDGYMINMANRTQNWLHQIGYRIERDDGNASAIAASFFAVGRWK